MASKANLIRAYCNDNGINNITFMKDVIVQDDMIDGVSNPYIKEWNISSLAQPTDEQLASYESVANVSERNGQVDSTRRSQYGTWQEQMEMIYKDQKEGTSTFKEHCDKVRTDNPKE